MLRSYELGIKAEVIKPKKIEPENKQDEEKKRGMQLDVLSKLFTQKLFCTFFFKF